MEAESAVLRLGNPNVGGVVRDIFANQETVDTSSVIVSTLEIGVKWDDVTNLVPAFGFPDGNDVALTVDGVLGTAINSFESFVVLNTDGSRKCSIKIRKSKCGRSCKRYICKSGNSRYK
jgi:hypothetical protein